MTTARTNSGAIFDFACRGFPFYSFRNEICSIIFKISYLISWLEDVRGDILRGLPSKV